MKATFKPLGLAAAVAAVAAGFAGVTQAQEVQPPVSLANNSLGDAAVIPYYTVKGDFITGLHIINTSDLTQVVKLRMRRGSDSMDALDFNLILSPEDEWTGFIDDSSGNIVLATEDKSCTAPLRADGRFEMPGLYAEGAGEGYIEIIGMGSATSSNPISVGALHSSEGVPADCAAVESNFFRNATVAPVPYDPSGSRGITSSFTSNQTCTNAIALATGAVGFGETCESTGTRVLSNVYGQAGNALKVSWFHRDATSGLEFGNSAVHLADFANQPMMSNQEVIVTGDTDAFGYLFPDLDGGSPIDGDRGRFEGVRSALGADSIINDWSVVAERNVSTDWVVTLPGQYLMLDLARYTLSLFDENVDCLTVEQANNLPSPLVPEQFYCDERDLPVSLSILVRDREEQTFVGEDSGLVISPSITNQPSTDELQYEVNVIQWSGGASVSPTAVLTSEYAKDYDVSALGSDFGWARLDVSAASNKTQGIYNFGASAVLNNPIFDPLTEISVPIVGFVAWERSFPENPSANYGRIVEHSYASSGD